MLVSMFDFLWWFFRKFEGFIKFNLVGLVGVIVNFSLLYILTDKVLLWYLTSTVIAVVVANTGNYMMNHYWTFAGKKEGNPNLFLGWLKYLFVIGSVEIPYLGLMYLFTSIMGFYYIWSAFFSLALTTVLRYIVADRWIWEGQRKVQQLSRLERLEQE
jgi:dolichol-phosphate mannosyltransferase